MNERILELAEQAKAESSQWLGSKPATTITYDELEKFAELIVRECIQNIRDNMEYAKVDTDGDKELFLETLRTSGHFYITELKAHFGVE